MAKKDEVNDILSFRPWPAGDPWVLVEAVVPEVEGEQRREVVALALETVSATLKANLAFVEGVRQIVGRKEA
jgi:hypothetical protein